MLFTTSITCMLYIFRERLLWFIDHKEYFFRVSPTTWKEKGGIRHWAE